MKYQIGSHLGFSGSLTKVIKNAIRYESHSVQFFLGNTQSYQRAILSEEDIEDAQELLRESKVNIFSHFPYISNLCGSVKCLAWSGNEKQDRQTKTLITNLEYELNTLAKVGGAVVIHVGSFPDKKKGIEAIAKSINQINFAEGSMLLIENCAGEGTKLPGTLHEIKRLIDLIEHKDHIGVCIDTCHLFAFGQYDLRKESDIDQFFIDFDQIIGREYLKLIHLNDSKNVFGSKADRHELILHGTIWNVENLTHFLEYVADIPIILETDPSDILVCKLLFP